MTTPLRESLTAEAVATPKWRRVEISDTELVRWTEDIRRYDHVYVGHSGVTIRTTMTKYLRWDTFPASNGELARRYLRRVYQGYGDDPGSRRSHPAGGGWQAPLYCSPVRSATLAYIDIKSAYWQLVSVWHPDDVILPRSGVLLPRGDRRWLTASTVETDRGLRHSIVGTIFADRLVEYRRGEEHVLPVRAAWTSPSLRREAMMTLHALALQVRRRFGLYAWMTDAAIVDAKVRHEVCAFLSSHWGIVADVRAMGRGMVLNTGSYVVGKKVTGDIESGRTTPARADLVPFSNLRRVPGNQIRQRRLRAMKEERPWEPTTT